MAITAGAVVAAGSYLVVTRWEDMKRWLQGLPIPVIPKPKPGPEPGKPAKKRPMAAITKLNVQWHHVGGATRAGTKRLPRTAGWTFTAGNYYLTAEVTVANRGDAPGYVKQSGAFLVDALQYPWRSDEQAHKEYDKQLKAAVYFFRPQNPKSKLLKPGDEDVFRMETPVLTKPGLYHIMFWEVALYEDGTRVEDEYTTGARSFDWNAVTVLQGP